MRVGPSPQQGRLKVDPQNTQREGQPNSPRRSVALVGAVGALGDTLLSTLLHSLSEGAVHVALRRPVQTALPQFVPFIWPLPACVDGCGPGVHVLSARELHAQVASASKKTR